MNHTPAPWHIEDGATIYGSRATRSDKFEICDCKGYKTEREANARLISAAPELLAALLECEALLPLYEYPQILKQVKAAIDKATK